MSSPTTRVNYRTPAPFNTTGPSMTKQASKQECDVNHIIKSFVRTGVLSHVNQSTPTYQDTSNITDYRGALAAISHANDLFSALPASLRSKFHNDPAQYLDFVSQPSNIDECIKLGLATSKKPLVDAQHQAKPAVGVPAQSATPGTVAT